MEQEAMEELLRKSYQESKVAEEYQVDEAYYKAAAENYATLSFQFDKAVAFEEYLANNSIPKL
jgi:hypothetical protein